MSLDNIDEIVCTETQEIQPKLDWSLELPTADVKIENCKYFHCVPIYS